MCLDRTLGVTHRCRLSWLNEGDDNGDAQNGKNWILYLLLTT